MTCAIPLLVVLLQASPLVWNDSFSLPPEAVAQPSHHQLLSIIGSKSQARSLIQRTIGEFIHGQRREDPKSHRGTIRVVADHLPKAWLPRIEDLRFERITPAQAEDRCLRRLWITAEVKGETLMLAVREGNDCGNSASLREFKRTSGKWLLVGGIDAGRPAIVGGAGRECPCFRK